MATINTEEFDGLFDKGGDVTPYMDMSAARYPNKERAARRISMDVPEELVRGLDRAAERMGVNRQAVIKVWLTERLDQETERQAARERATV
ncbi:type II toxin-antitoxin system BrnA family antitoxin [Ellagibacter isourolithinifaciens]|uniref:type II toxin-antitoxin system BrnA family antitoxin n=1 Tax=Ellagibacter isourolithinifaciens TaxID=2137581 RepID=UPI0023F52A8B|nr:CopG family antitoxin [Ellagibacter isourolithinifaciens]MDD5926064.1 CopG family antitoxin [Ellagibacter isourolithinifaciens]